MAMSHRLSTVPSRVRDIPDHDRLEGAMASKGLVRVAAAAVRSMVSASGARPWGRPSPLPAVGAWPRMPRIDDDIYELGARDPGRRRRRPRSGWEQLAEAADALDRR